jgi:hypothetical protein
MSEQQKIDKHEGAEMKCATCGLDLVCRGFEYQGKKVLSWCDKDTNQKHYKYDQEKQESKCNYLAIITQYNLLERVDKLINTKMAGYPKEQRQHYIDLLFNKILVAN